MASYECICPAGEQCVGTCQGSQITLDQNTQNCIGELVKFLRKVVPFLDSLLKRESEAMLTSTVCRKPSSTD